MGGHALKNTFIERKNTEVFLSIGKEIQDTVLNDIGIETAIVKCYHTKADHGDLDLLLKITPNLDVDWRLYILNTFKPNEVVKNDKVYSFDYKHFQIDFILIKEKCWNTAQTYYSYDCAGNCMGKTYHKFGLSYGWEGLFYKYRNSHGTNSANILLTNDVRRIFKFGGYDYDRYLKGFDTLEEIFRFVINGKYFDTEMFQMENLKSIDKKRNRKRGSYHLFLNYLKNNNINVSYPFNKVKTDYITTINNFFPEANLTSKLHELQEKERHQSMIRQKFNGDIVMSWLPNLHGGELGQAMSKFKNSFACNDEFENFILDATYKEIHDSFLSDFMLHNSY